MQNSFFIRIGHIRPVLVWDHMIKLKYSRRSYDIQRTESIYNKPN